MTSTDYTLRLARSADLPQLQKIERAAAQLFLDSSIPSVAEGAPVSTWELRRALRRGFLHVLALPDDTPVGFTLLDIIDDAMHLQELDVHPDYGQRGLGTRLIEHVCACAASQGYHAVTLTTFRDVPWNAPFYARRGFRVLREDELTPGLWRALDYDAAVGLPPEQRVCMRRELESAGRPV
jgi:GNAT superfamily N-acetyltransferase